MPSRPATPVQVLINGSQNPTLRPLSVRRSSGGKQRDEATFLVDLSDKGTGTGWIQNFTMTPGGAVCQVVAYPNGVPQTIHWGKVDVTSIAIGENETLTFTSRVEPYHFGQVMEGVYSWEPVSGQLVTIQEDLVFNPEIDSQVFGNQSGQYRLFGLAPVILDPESVRTRAAKTVQGDTAQFWTLQTAVAYLCWALNSQVNIKNPLAAAIALLPQWPLNHFRLERGKFLGDYLDDLLPRFGVGWYLDLSLGLPTIAFFVRGLGLPNTVYLGPPGAFFSGDNALDTDLHYDVGNTRNQAVVVGDWRYVESTFTLQKGWPESLDNTAETNLSKDSAGFENVANPYRDVWRKWVYNEAGDYVGTRAEITAPPNVSSLLGHPVTPRRRRFLPCIAQDQDGAPFGRYAGCFIEFSTDGGGTWSSIETLEDRTCMILDRECGIRFDGLFPPPELRRAAGTNATTPNKAQVRITAVIRDDQRLQKIVGPDAASPLADVAPFHVDASAHFHWREILSSSQLYQDVQSGEIGSSITNDQQALTDYATWLQQTFDVGDVNGSILIEGLDTIGAAGAYDLGQVLTGILGRAISFNAQSPASGQLRCPQIVGITYDYQRQTRRLHVETFRDPGDSEALNADRWERKMVAAAKKAHRGRR
jgi:hypothetical protein